MELIYAYIRKQGVLKNIGLSFSPYYTVTYDDAKGTLSIVENNDFPKDFFEDPVISITGIVGNNGSGKSTAIYWLLRALVDGSGETEPDGILLFKERRGKNFKIYKGKNFQHVSPKPSFTKGTIKTLEGRFKPHISCCYFSGHFTPYIQMDVDSGEFSGETNISDKWLLIKDYQNFTAEDSNHLHHPLFHYLNAHVIQDAYRITQFLMDKTIRMKFEEDNLMQLPNFIMISPNKAGRTKLTRMNESDKKMAPHNYSEVILERHLKYQEEPKQELINSFIIESFINYIAENFAHSEELINLFWSWVQYPGSQDVVQDFATFIDETDNKVDAFLLNLLSVIRMLVSTAEVYTKWQTSTFYLPVADSTKLQYFSEELLRSSLFLTCRFFDLSYTFDLHSFTKLSSGERAMLNLLSRIYWYFKIDVAKFANLEIPAMLILDEAEIGFHPDWQRKYLWILTRFLKIFMQNPADKPNQGSPEIQIIYTTHSPITLADLPKECVNFLKREGNHVFNRAIGMPQTFAENVFELYRHSFFMKDGLLGKMAEEYIKKISQTLEQGLTGLENKQPNLNELVKQIGIIGDKRIRNYLLEKYAALINDNDLDSQIARKEMELARLKQLKKEQQNDYEEN